MNMQSRGSIDARYSGDAMNRVSTGGVTSGKNPMISNNLATVVRGLKGRISHLIKQNTTPFKCQTRFYDHIIKSQNELDNVAIYIENNVAQGDLDELNKPYIY